MRNRVGETIEREGKSKRERGTDGEHGYEMGGALLHRAKKAWRNSTRPSPPKSGVSHQHLATILSSKIPKPQKALALWAFYALARLKELFSARWPDLSRPQTDQPVKLFLPNSKTDIFRRGAFLVIPWQIWTLIAELLSVDRLAPPTRGHIFGFNRNAFIRPVSDPSLWWTQFSPRRRTILLGCRR